MTIAGPWYISARACRQLADLMGWEGEQGFRRAEGALVRIAQQVVRERRTPRRSIGPDMVEYRVAVDLDLPRRRDPSGRSHGRPRLVLVVSSARRSEGPLPQLIAVRRG